jgi:hypothetical protein
MLSFVLPSTLPVAANAHAHHSTIGKEAFLFSVEFFVEYLPKLEGLGLAHNQFEVGYI